MQLELLELQLLQHQLQLQQVLQLVQLCWSATLLCALLWQQCISVTRSAVAAVQLWQQCICVTRSLAACRSSIRNVQTHPWTHTLQHTHTHTFASGVY
jgi:hypothetical protein